MKIFLPLILAAAVFLPAHAPIQVFFVVPPGETYTPAEQEQDLAEIQEGIDFWHRHTDVTASIVETSVVTLTDPLWYNEGWGFYRDHLPKGQTAIFVIENRDMGHILWNIAPGWNDNDRHAMLITTTAPGWSNYGLDMITAHEGGHLFLNLPDTWVYDCTDVKGDIMSYPDIAWAADRVGDCTTSVLYED